MEGSKENENRLQRTAEKIQIQIRFNENENSKNGCKEMGLMTEVPSDLYVICTFKCEHTAYAIRCHANDRVLLSALHSHRILSAWQLE